jgi:hypothetical protein
MAKKGSFGFDIKAASGNAAGFSNIPGASSYSVSFGKQFAKSFKEGFKKNKVGDKKPAAQGNVPGAQQDTTPAPTVNKKAAPKTKESGGRLGNFTVKQNEDGTKQVKTRTKSLSLEDLKSGKYSGPIAPENIPDSYKPQGSAPSERTWSPAEKAALESERPASYVSPTFKPEPDTAENVARRRAELTEATKPKKSTESSPRQFSTVDYSDRPDVIQTKSGPAVDLRNMK